MSDANNASAQDQLPQIDFSTFILSLSHSALVNLGEVPSDEPGAQDMELARQTIDIIALLAEKTRGNLTGEEERLLEQVLYELKMRFVEVSKGRK